MMRAPALKSAIAGFSLMFFAPLALAQTGDVAAPAEQIQTLNIPAGPLADALDALVEQSGIQLIYRDADVDGLTTSGVRGETTPEAALDLLLQGTRLGVTVDATGAMAVGDPAAFADTGADAGPFGEGDGTAATDIASARRAGVEEIIVTGQKKAERLQDVPIAISAFSMDQLDAQKIEGGFDLLKGVPNVTFSKTNFSGYNFQIRGIGTQAISATTDPGVAVSFNNTTLIVNRLFEQEYLDIERVEVLRGPQGTLYGRNATAGVINVISAKPVLGEESGEIKLETGNYNAKRIRGHYNLPLGDTLALRGAYASTVRDGFGYNQASESNATRTFGDDVRSDVDGRDLWTGRLTLGWEPTDAVRVNLLWERFEEDDNRVRTSKQLCHRDDSIEHLAGYDTSTLDTTTFSWAGYSQGCEGGSLYAADAYGTPNAASLPYIYGSAVAVTYGMIPIIGPNGYYGLGGNPFKDDPSVCSDMNSRNGFVPYDLCNLDVYRGEMQSRDLRSIYSLIEPIYQAESDIFELSLDINLTDELLFSSQTVYVKDEYYASQDYNRLQAYPIFSDSNKACDINVISGKTEIDCAPGAGENYADGFYSDISPDGIFCDPQLGCSDTMIVQDLSQSTSKQLNQEFRLVSSYGGDWNFSLGANFTRFETLNDYYVFSNMFTHLLNFWPFNFDQTDCGQQGLQYVGGVDCRYVDPNSLDSINGEGHNYFRSANPYELTSTAEFGEMYWNVTDALKLTAGLRFTWDQKVFSPVPSQLLLYNYRYKRIPGVGPETCTAFTGEPGQCALAGNAPGGRGSVADPDIIQEWHEPTGRIVLDWKPLLPFTDETLLYASLARGYKGGGANPPSVAPPAKTVFDRASGGFADTFKPEYVNAVELGSKNKLFDGALILNFSGFYYDYTDYQVSKIVDRRAVNENYDATVWGLELESVFSPSYNWSVNAAIGYLRTRIADGEASIDLMDRTDGGFHHFAADPDATFRGRTTDFADGFDEWVVVKPSVLAGSNCVVPAELLRAALEAAGGIQTTPQVWCGAGNVASLQAGDLGGSNAFSYYDDQGNLVTNSTRRWYAALDAPNGGAGFEKDLSGNELPSAPRWTVSLGSQYTVDFTARWSATARVDWYWQDDAYARVYNTEIDKLQDWTNTNLSFWVTQADWGFTVEAYVKNLFDETPITGTFLNSDDSGLSTNVFTLDPQLIGLSIKKSF